MSKSHKSFLDVEEHRKFERVPSESEVWVRNTTRFAQGAEESDSRGTLHQLMDLSFNGAKLVGPSSAGSADDRLELLLPGRSGEPISIIGVIVRSQEVAGSYETAIRFARISVTEQMKLTELLAELGEESIGQFKSAPLSPMRKSHALHKKRGLFRRK